MAAGITEATIEEIKARIDLVDLVSSYGIEVKTAGATKKACCPFHHERTPSFNINENRGFYHCFGCGESGDAIKFVQKMDGLTFIEAVKKLAEQCGVKIEEKEDPTVGKRKRLHALLVEIAQFYHRCLLKAKEGELAREYLRTRDLNAQVQDDYLIGYAPSGVAIVLKWAEKYKYTPEELEAAGIIKGPTKPGDLGYHRFGGRLMFAIRDKQGRVVGFSGRQLVASKNSGKYVNSPETLVFKKSNVLYGFDKAAGAITKAANREAIVCEGQIDCIRLQTTGFPNAVAGQGTAFTDEHVKMLKKVADQVALVYDDDGAGHKATIKSARLCLAAELPVRVVSLPGGDDPDSFLRTHPSDEFRAMLADAESIMSFQVRAEKAKEKDPNSVAAVNRITKEILLTISQCPNAVLRASMLGEAAKLLKLPTAALEMELAKVKELSHRSEPVRRSAPPSDEPDDTAVVDEPEDDAVLEGEAAESVAPPPRCELDLCAFLMANEYDKTLDGMVGEFLPSRVFAHDFTIRFVETWRAEVASGEDLISGFGAKLAPRGRAFFDEILLSSGKSQPDVRPTTEVLQGYIRRVWADALVRKRGSLPANGDSDVVEMQMKLSTDHNHLANTRWSVVKEIIRDWLFIACAALLLLLPVCVVAESAANAPVYDWDKAKDVAKGVKVIEQALESPRLMKTYMMRIDLKTPGLRFTGTERAESFGQPMPDVTNRTVIIDTRRERTVDFMTRRRATGENMLVAFNSAPWDPFERPFTHKFAHFDSVEISDGVKVSHAKGFWPTFVVWKDGTAVITNRLDEADFPKVAVAHSGFNTILRDGVPPRASGKPSLAPRIAYGLSKDGRWLYVLAVDGRQPDWSLGADMCDLASLMLAAGADDAMNVDGGGSTTLVYWDAAAKKPVVLNRHDPKKAHYRSVALNIGLVYE